MGNLLVADVPLVTISIPVFNGLPFLTSALESVHAQTYPNLEIVIVDGGSDSETVDYLKTLDRERYRLEFLPAGTPVETTWTRSCELAQGDFIKLLCQDDLLYPDAIATQVAALQASPGAGLVFSRRDIVDARARTVAKARGGIRGGSRTLPGSQALRFGFLAGSNIYGEPLAVLFRASTLRQNLPWRADIPYLIDMSMYADVMRTDDVAYEDAVVGAFRISSQSWSTRLTKQQTEQFRQWQAVAAETTLNVTDIDRLRASTSAVRVSWMRSLAYLWLRLTKRLS